MKRTLLVLSLLLAACGSGGGGETPTEIRWGWIGWDGETLAITHDRGDHFEVEISTVLLEDSDADRPPRVCVKEIHRCFEGLSPPDAIGADWYLHSGDSLDPFAPIPAAEVAWLSQFDPLDIVVPLDPILAGWVETARLRINDAVGFELLTNL